ncbi:MULTISPECIES: hypothetical protein [Hungatella]|uniref:Anti-sigma factor RsgI-like middle domain-containing protein n=2 Tax=Hungatella hathewayi TaxID=154046 RepID=A0AAW9WBH4_9FIRM|nr:MULTISPECIES: hypothetical protein [Hungatella]MCQ4831456.1 hypothetical protein [Hungatella sp. SL.1.14]MUB62203.1 hypothetical protein [Hungatella hathewayi]
MSKKIETSQINQSLNRAVSQLPQPSLQKIIDTPVVKMERMDDITGQEPLKGGWFCRLCSPVQVRRMAAVCGCALFFLAAGIGGVYSYQNLVVDSIVDMDVNPSFELKINKKDRVLSFVPLNEDAVQAAEGHTYKDWNIEEAVKDLYRIMEEKAYLTDDRKTVLISVENKNPTRVNQLQSQLSACIRKTAEESKRTVHIVTQEKKKDGALDQTALNYHISSGKLQFIRMMTAAYPDLDEMTLSRMSMEELYRIILEREKEKPVWLQMDEEDWNEYKEEMRKAKYGDRDSSDDIDDDDSDDDDSDDNDSDDNNLDDHESDDRDPADDDFDDRDSDNRNSADHDDLDDADSPGKNVDDDSEDKASDDDDSDSKASDDEDSDSRVSDDEDSDGKVSVNNDSDDKAPDDDESGSKASDDDNSDDRDSDNDDSEDEPDD